MNRVYERTEIEGGGYFVAELAPLTAAEIVHCATVYGAIDQAQARRIALCARACWLALIPPVSRA